jgi:spore germination cell wall hydrolase CwlJ-like protein
MISKQFLFYIVALVVCLVLLDNYKEYSMKENEKTAPVAIKKFVKKTHNKEKNCLMNALYYEARSESNLGILAVASVIENRKNSGSYPSTYCKVINQHKQFSYTLEGKPDVEKVQHMLTAYDKQAYQYISELSHRMTTGSFEPILPKTVMWYATKKVSNAWTKSKKIYATIGFHHFYKKKDAPNENKRKY